MDATIYQIELSLIDEDPAQPRTEFNKESLFELAETIRFRGVKTPISVRPNPLVEGRYIINHGARRFRASAIAGKQTIPACIDMEYTEEDQLIENLQRDNLTPREISVFLEKLRKKGHKKGEIAKIIGKSPSWVTQHITLLELPPRVATIFENGRCNDVTVLYELAKMERNVPEHLGAWLEDEHQEINRGTVKLLQDFLTAQLITGNTEAAPKKSKQVSSGKSKKLKPPVVHVEIDNQPAILLLDRQSNAKGFAWFCAEGGDPFEAALEGVHLKEVRGE